MTSGTSDWESTGPSELHKVGQRGEYTGSRGLHRVGQLGSVRGPPCATQGRTAWRVSGYLGQDNPRQQSAFPQHARSSPMSER